MTVTYLNFALSVGSFTDALTILQPSILTNGSYTAAFDSIRSIFGTLKSQEKVRRSAGLCFQYSGLGFGLKALVVSNPLF